ncbi:hypothetical protein [Bacillus thuringiensis]|uniref:hypothetical protein n=1 Tax=Bacillus thuringiensis TaxID=1428 RepID=UPI000BFCC887|nr:hypothetical protein [Bacillus thuringiensis]PGT90035.1 hypothetical protein COD17_09810 [Bacillus thuringiensis]
MLGYFMANGKKGNVGRQNFVTGTVKVEEGRVTVCDMFSDFEGDIAFNYKGETVWFRYITAV